MAPSKKLPVEMAPSKRLTIQKPEPKKFMIKISRKKKEKVESLFDKMAKLGEGKLATSIAVETLQITPLNYAMTSSLIQGRLTLPNGRHPLPGGRPKLELLVLLTMLRNIADQ